jgi:hypothetical protein
MCEVLLLLISFLLLILLQVWFLEEEKLPVVSGSLEENKYKILMKSPWEILQSAVGSGGFIDLFTKHSIADNLINMGVEYVEVRLSFPLH